MNTITNISNVTDYSGEPPIVTYSNPVTTTVPTPDSPIKRHFYRPPCDACGPCCNVSCCSIFRCFRFCLWR